MCNEWGLIEGAFVDSNKLSVTINKISMTDFIVYNRKLIVIVRKLHD